MPRISGSWSISVHYSPARFPPDTTSGINGYSDDAPYFGQISGGTQWSLTSSFDGRIMYANWIGVATAYPVIDSAVFTAVNLPHDCINGTCIPKSQYNTPGLYQSLSDCEAICANGGACGSGKQCVDPTTFCPDGKVCIEQGEYSSIEGLISKIGSEVC